MNEFCNELDRSLKSRIRELAEQISGAGSPARVPPMAELLKAALKNEWETTLLSSLWVADEGDRTLRVALARLAGDEARHYTLIEKRLLEMGGSLPGPELDDRSPLFSFLLGQQASFDRIVAGPYTREALAVARNTVFLEHCRETGAVEIVDMYAEIQADEEHHHQLGRRLLAERLRTPEDLERALSVMSATLQVVDDIQAMIVMQKGLCRIPGC